MNNSYQDNLRRGLSKFQISILVWISLIYRPYLHEPEKDRGEELSAENKLYREYTEPKLDIHRNRRPSFYGQPNQVLWENNKHHDIESAELSRALRRLEERGLIERNYYSQEGQGTCTTYVALTESGIDLSNRLTK